MRPPLYGLLFLYTSVGGASELPAWQEKYVRDFPGRVASQRTGYTRRTVCWQRALVVCQSTMLSRHVGVPAIRSHVGVRTGNDD